MLYNAATAQSNMPSQEAISLYGGKWVLGYVKKDGLTFNLYESDISSDEIPYFELNDDGTAVGGVSNDSSSMGIWVQSDNGVIVGEDNMIFKDGQLYLETEDLGMLIYEKASDRYTSKKNLSENAFSSFGENLSDFYGTWEPVYIIVNGIKAEITDAKALGYDNFYFILKKDNAACWNYNNQYQETTWSKDKSGISLNQGNLRLKLYGDKLSLTGENIGDMYFDLYFEKTSSITYSEETDEDYIRPEFKEMMDQYEAFFDDYIAFMKKYLSASSNDATTVFGMLQDYLDWLKKYSEVMEDFEDIGDGDLTRAEAFYYAEVSLRIEEKLLSVIY